MKIQNILSVLLTAIALPVLSQETTPPVLGEEAHKLLLRMYDYDPAIPLEARIVERKDNDSHVRFKIVFRGVRGAMVPGYLQLPATGTAPYPCVLLMHGWSGSAENWWEDNGYLSGGNVRKALLKAGCAVLALDAQAHGDRIAENDYHVVNLYEDPEAPPRKNYFTIREIITQTLLDYRRGLDYLDTRDDIDMDRIGIVGYSMGGFHSVALTAVESRIKASVGCVVPVTWREDPILDPANYMRSIGKRPFMMVQGREDSLCNEAQSKKLYTYLEHEDTRLLLYGCEHRLPVDYVGVAIPWLVDHL